MAVETDRFIFWQAIPIKNVSILSGIINFSILCQTNTQSSFSKRNTQHVTDTYLVLVRFRYFQLTRKLLQGLFFMKLDSDLGLAQNVIHYGSLEGPLKSLKNSFKSNTRKHVTKSHFKSCFFFNLLNKSLMGIISIVDQSVLALRKNSLHCERSSLESAIVQYLTWNTICFWNEGVSKKPF